MTHRYACLGVLAVLSCTALAIPALADVNVERGDWLICEYFNLQVKHFDSSGVYEDMFADNLPGGRTQDVVLSPDGQYVFVATGDLGSGSVAVFDACDGTFLYDIVEYANYPGKLASELAFAPTGELIVSITDHDPPWAGTILSCDITTGVVTELFSGGYKPWSMGVAPNGNIFWGEYDNSDILEYEYDGSTWTQVRVITDPSLQRCQGIAFGPDGRMYVLNNIITPNPEMLEFTFDDTTQQWIKTAEYDSDLLDEPVDIAFGPDGLAYVVGHYSNKVVRFDVDTSDWEVFIDSDLDHAVGIAFRSGDCNDNGTPDWLDIVLEVVEDRNGNNIPDDCDIEGDLNGDGAVDLVDLAILLAQYGAQVYHCLD